MKGISHLFKLLLLWLSLWFVYLISAGEAGLQEVVAGGVVSAGVSLLSLRARSAPEERFLPRLRWLLPFLKVPWTTLQESWLLLQALVRKIFRSSSFKGGSFIDYPLPPVSDGEEISRYAVTTIGVCLTPNDYIISIDRKRSIAQIRILVGRDLSGADRAFLELK